MTAANSKEEWNTKEAMHYVKGENKRADCKLCPQYCHIPNGQAGFCRIRENREGTLYAQYYGKVASLGFDPIEKKPLYHFHPGTMILSAGGYSCNFRCGFCQNHSLSMALPPWVAMPPEELVERGLDLVPQGNIGIAYTYNEPFINYEYMLDSAKLAASAGLLNVVVTNGYVNPRPLEEILPYIHGMNIDLKGFTGDYYKTLAGKLEPVMETIRMAAGSCHVELTTLIVPGENDDPALMDKMCRWIAEINPAMPLHLSRFFPHYQMIQKPPTPKDTMLRLMETARKTLRYVYFGNF